MSGPLLAGDWGSTNLRLFLLAPDGQILKSRQTAQGVRGLAPNDFPGVFADLATSLLEGETPAGILLCGMVGARQGWREAAYVAAPAGAADIAAAFTPIETALGPAWLVPGLSVSQADGTMDVMRGEETQILGAGAKGLVVTPGTHSKWARVEAGRIVGFETHMTGELFEMLKRHSMLGLMIEEGEADPDAFRLGVERIRQGGALTHLLFTVRSEGLFGRLGGPALGSYLSGLLIGAEVAAGLGAAGAPDGLTLIADPRLAELYRQALAVFDVTPCPPIDGGEAVARGLTVLWRQRSLT